MFKDAKNQHAIVNTVKGQGKSTWTLPSRQEPPTETSFLDDDLGFLSEQPLLFRPPFIGGAIEGGSGCSRILRNPKSTKPEDPFPESHLEKNKKNKHEQ